MHLTGSNGQGTSNSPNNVHNNIKTIGSMRRTQLITTFGPGSIFDFPGYSVIIGATDYWDSKGKELEEHNLKKLLNISHLREPNVSPDAHHLNPDVAAIRFPTMYFCPSCHKLMPYWGFGNDDNKKCKDCKKNIVPSRFIIACINGHLEDFPYHWWVHHKHPEIECIDKNNDHLKITFLDSSGGLDSIIITCTKCGLSSSMAGCMNKGALNGYKCHGKRPWIGIDDNYNEAIPCHAPMRTLQRGASNVYFPVTESALTIPPWSNRVQQCIPPDFAANIKILMDNKIDSETLQKIIENKYENNINCQMITFKDFKNAVIERAKTNDTTINYTKQNLIEDEYKSFCSSDIDDKELKTEHTQVPIFFNAYIEDVVLVRRLREVMVLRGFRRITPEQPNDKNKGKEDDKFKGYYHDLVPLYYQNSSWLPAIEMLGEGIFIKLKEDCLNKWERLNSGVYDRMKNRLDKSNVGCDNFSPRFVLLHTLSHLLIRQLAIECGYSGASIKERIYSTYPNSKLKMSGILLYTSTSDSDGSLGGLVRKGLAASLDQTLRSMLQEASWCSSDPICIDSESQGYDSLNYAACHACTLLPETSCQVRNCLLDRAAIVGTIDKKERGLFSALLNK